MARKKSDIRAALTKSHLHAIGLVAAEWSLLEFYILFIISRMSETKLVTTTIMSGSGNVAGWLEMIQKFADRNTDYAPGIAKLKAVCKSIKSLQTERNNIVHACWLSSSTRNYLDKASGFGIPKRGKQTYIPVDKSAPEMRDAAKRIAAAQSALLSWWAAQPKPQAERLASLAQIDALGRGLLTTQPKQHTLRSLLSRQPKTSSLHCSVATGLSPSLFSLVGVLVTPSPPRAGGEGDGKPCDHWPRSCISACSSPRG